MVCFFFFRSKRFTTFTDVPGFRCIVISLSRLGNMWWFWEVVVCRSSGRIRLRHRFKWGKIAMFSWGAFLWYNRRPDCGLKPNDRIWTCKSRNYSHCRRRSGGNRYSLWCKWQTRFWLKMDLTSMGMGLGLGFGNRSSHFQYRFCWSFWTIQWRSTAIQINYCAVDDTRAEVRLPREINNTYRSFV